MWAEKRMDKEDADVVATFDDIDTNEDGYIDKDELFAFIRDQRALHSELFQPELMNNPKTEKLTKEKLWDEVEAAFKMYDLN